MKSMLAALTAGVSLFACAVPAAMADPGPPLSVPSDRLQAALHCPSAFTHPQHEPVLLVHGTGADAASNWGWNYLRALPAAGFDACAVDLPDHALGDIQTSAEYVVYAIRTMHAATGGKVDVIGHSQGPLEPRWAIKWWPDVRADVDDLVGLSSPNHGVPAVNLLCLIACDAADWQFSAGSAFLKALNAGDETPGTVDQTSVISASDGIVEPATTSSLVGAANVWVQSRCPLRIVNHVRMAYDAVVYAIVLDALTHAGPARLSRISPLVCFRDLMPKVSYGDVLGFAADLALRLVPGALVHEKAGSEPRLRAYAVG
jgi:triacylglycerol lipase